MNSSQRLFRWLARAAVLLVFGATALDGNPVAKGCSRGTGGCVPSLIPDQLSRGRETEGRSSG